MILNFDFLSIVITSYSIHYTKLYEQKYGINVEIVQINDYIESINQFSAGEFDGCTMANTDALGIPAAGGVDSTALIIGDFSNGNDVVISKEAKSIKDLKGTNVNSYNFV